jgi:type I restriction enzyme, S subunit
MTHGTARISDLVFPASNWNSSASADKNFVYVDISSVDASQKMIVEPKSVPCSSAPSRARQLLKPADVLVSTVRPNLNCVAYVPGELEGAIASTGFCVLRPDEQALNSRYLFHWVQSKAFIGDMVSKATGASYPAVSDSIILASKISLPPLEEQRRIAAILDRAGSLQSLSQSAIAKLHQTLESSFRHLSSITAYNCASKRLEEVVEAIIDYRGKSPEKTAEGVPLITARLIKEGRILEATEFIAPESYSEWMRRGMPKRGDVVFTTEAPLGQVAQIDNPDVALAQRLVLLRGKSKELDNTYLRFALRMNSVAEQIRKRATGSTVLGIRQKELRQIEIPLPALEVQRNFAKLALAIESEIQRLRHRADSVKALKDSLANRLMEG